MENQMIEVSLIQQLSLFMEEGGVFMWIILVIWCGALGIALERLKTLIKYDTNGKNLMGIIKKNVLINEIGKAIEACSNTSSVLAFVMHSGLRRANQTKEQIQDVLESSILESISKIEKRLDYLALIANVSTLVGLLGTIYGLIQSFAAVAGADPAQKAKLLALGISKAMNTTALGLISAITLMVIHTILSNKAGKIVSDLEEFSTKLIDLLGTKKGEQKTESNHSEAA
jgi:biopolymer transport protein ExbB